MEVISNAKDVDLNLMPKHEMDGLARSTLRAAERFFATPGIMEKFEKWYTEEKIRKRYKNVSSGIIPPKK